MTFLALGIAHGVRRKGGTISVDLSVFVLLKNTNFVNKLKFNDKKKFKKKIIHYLYKYSIIYKITPLSTKKKGWST